MQSETISQTGKQGVLAKKQQGDKVKLTSEQEAVVKKKVIIGKIIIVCSAIICMSMVIFILAKSSSYFAFMFTLDTELSIKKYLRSHYNSYMSALYFSIFGLVIVVADTILFFFKFSQKNKLIWFHVGYYIAIFIVVIVAISNKSYNSYMGVLKAHVIGDIECANVEFYLQCHLAPAYYQYRDSFITFFIVFSIFFALYTAVYHYYVLYIVPFQLESNKQQQENKSVIFSNIQAHQNETFVSQMFEEYGN